MTIALLDTLDVDYLSTVTADNGDIIATLNIGSNMLPHVTVDTYSTFNGDSTFEMEASHWVDGVGFNDNEVDLSVSDHDAVIRELGEVMLGIMGSACEYAPGVYDRQIVTPGKLTSVYSPRAYNFATDSFAADYEVNLTALSEWLTLNSIDADSYGRETFKSYDGFHSFVPSRLDSPDGEERTETLAWLAVHAYMASVLDRDELFMAGAEAEGEIYMKHTTASVRHDAYTDRLDKRVAALLAVTDVDTLDISAMAETAGVDYFGETPDPSDLMERVEADAQKILTAATES